MNFVIPMAGAGSICSLKSMSFQPRFMADIDGVPLFIRCLSKIHNGYHLYFIMRRDDYNTYPVDFWLKKSLPHSRIILLDDKTAGQACTALAAANRIDNDDPLVIMNPDILVSRSDDVIDILTRKEIDGGLILAAQRVVCGDPYFYCRLDQGKSVKSIETRDGPDLYAVAGAYYWQYGFQFVRSARKMIENNSHFNNRFYVAPVFNWAIYNENMKVTPYIVQKASYIQRRSHVAAYLREG